MTLRAADWLFRVDVSKTREMTQQYSLDHCTCGYCKNYYETAPQAYPQLFRFLGEFGISMGGPVEIMPFTPTCVLACYRVWGEIRNWGNTPLIADGIRILPEAGEDGVFHLWVGEMNLPWLQKEDPESVVSPANLPEFLERMGDIWRFRHEQSPFFS